MHGVPPGERIDLIAYQVRSDVTARELDHSLLAPTDPKYIMKQTLDIEKLRTSYSGLDIGTDARGHIRTSSKVKVKVKAERRTGQRNVAHVHLMKASM